MDEKEQLEHEVIILEKLITKLTLQKSNVELKLLEFKYNKKNASNTISKVQGEHIHSM